MRRLIVLVLVTAAAPAAAEPGRHLVHAEALGKGGPYGDNVYPRGLGVGAAGVGTDVGGSDHWPVWVDVIVAP